MNGILIAALVVSVVVNIVMAVKLSQTRRQLYGEREDRRRSDYLHYTSVDAD